MLLKKIKMYAKEKRRQFLFKRRIIGFKKKILRLQKEKEEMRRKSSLDLPIH